MLKGFQNGSLYGEARTGGEVCVVELHGWAHTSLDFYGVNYHLLTEYPEVNLGTLALDLPGFGASPPPPVGCGTEYYASAVAETLREYLGGDPGVKRFIVVGHSFGGRIAVRLQGEHPDLPISGVVLSGVPFFRSRSKGRPALGYRLIKALAQGKIIPQSRLEEARQRYGSSDYRQTQGVMREVFVATVNEDYRHFLPTMRVPSVLLWGERDDQAPLCMAEEALPLIRHGELEVLRGVGHMVPTDAPEALGDVVVKLATVPA